MGNWALPTCISFFFFSVITRPLHNTSRVHLRLFEMHSWLQFYFYWETKVVSLTDTLAVPNWNDLFIYSTLVYRIKDQLINCYLKFCLLVGRTQKSLSHSSPFGKIINGPRSLVWTLHHLSINETQLFKATITYDSVPHLILQESNHRRAKEFRTAQTLPQNSSC